MTASSALLERIAVDPEICFGMPCVKGTRIWVSVVLDWLSSGWSIQQVIEEYPQLEEADVFACLAYGAEMARNRLLDIPTAGQG